MNKIASLLRDALHWIIHNATVTYGPAWTVDEDADRIYHNLCNLLSENK